MRCWGELRSLRAQSVGEVWVHNFQYIWKWKSARPTTDEKLATPMPPFSPGDCITNEGKPKWQIKDSFHLSLFMRQRLRWCYLNEEPGTSYEHWELSWMGRMFLTACEIKLTSRDALLRTLHLEVCRFFVINYIFLNWWSTGVTLES